MVRKNHLCKNKIYDFHHIQEVGTDCHFKHTEYHWPAKISSDHCIIGDSIVKFIKITNHADVKAFPGITIERLYWKVRLNKVDLKQYKIILVHVGTNDIITNSVKGIINSYCKLIEAVKIKNPKAQIGVSSILPRPCDGSETNQVVEVVNREIKSICCHLGAYFVPSYRPFVKCYKAGSCDLFAKDRLHLNFKGSVTLRKNLVGNIISLQGLRKEQPSTRKVKL